MKHILTIVAIGAFAAIVFAADEPLPPATPVKYRVGTTNEIDLAQLSKTKWEWPELVTNTVPLNFPIIQSGKAIGTYEVAAGTSLKLLSLMTNDLFVAYQTFTNHIPVMATDLLSVIASNRFARFKSHVEINGQKYVGVQMVTLFWKVPNTITIVHKDGANNFLKDKAPEDWLDAWGLTKAYIEKAHARASAERVIRKDESTDRTVVEKIGPRPETDPNDGSCQIVKEYMKKYLPDGEEVEYTEWRGPDARDWKNWKAWVVQIRYKFKNNAGAKTEREATLYIQWNKVQYIHAPE